MNSKPKSWSALKKSVQAADVQAMPSAKLGAKRADKLILNCIAEAGSDLGVGARPGNAAIEAAAGLRWSQCHEHIVGLEKAGLLKRTPSVGGRGLASIYQILWNDPVFPDHSPNGREWFIEKPSGLEERNHPVSEAKPSGLESETIRFETGNHPGSNGQPSGLEAKPSGVRPEHIPIPSEQHPNPIPTSAMPQTGMAEARSWKAFVEKPGNLPDAYDGSVEGNLIADLEAKLREFGERLLSEIFWQHWRDRKMPLDTYPGNRFKASLAEAFTRKNIDRARENAKRAKSSAHIWWENNTPEGRAAFDNQEAAGQLAGEKILREFARQKEAEAEERVREETQWLVDPADLFRAK